MELSRSPMAQIVPSCLDDDHFTDDCTFWDPERWFMGTFEKVGSIFHIVISLSFLWFMGT